MAMQNARDGIYSKSISNLPYNSEYKLIVC